MREPNIDSHLEISFSDLIILQGWTESRPSKTQADDPINTSMEFRRKNSDAPTTSVLVMCLSLLTSLTILQYACTA